MEFDHAFSVAAPIEEVAMTRPAASVSTIVAAAEALLRQ
jgi:hypothetical protein